MSRADITVKHLVMMVVVVTVVLLVVGRMLAGAAGFKKNAVDAD